MFEAETRCSYQGHGVDGTAIRIQKLWIPIMIWISTKIAIPGPLVPKMLLKSIHNFVSSGNLAGSVSLSETSDHCDDLPDSQNPAIFCSWAALDSPLYKISSKFTSCDQILQRRDGRMHL